MGSVTSLSGFGGCKLEAYGFIIVLKVKLISILASILFNSYSLLYITSVYVCYLYSTFWKVLWQKHHLFILEDKACLFHVFVSAYYEVCTITKYFWCKGLSSKL